jgi:hypothetical protein
VKIKSGSPERLLLFDWIWFYCGDQPKVPDKSTTACPGSAGQIQDLRIQRTQMVHQAECDQTQMGLKAAERSGDTVQAKVLQDR